MTARVGPGAGRLIRALQRGGPLRRLPVWARYSITVAIVLVCFAAHYALDAAYSYPYPYLGFLFGVVLTAFILDRGCGFLATALGAGLALYVFVEPRGSFLLADIGSLLSVALFVAVGLLTASVVETLRMTVEELAAVSEGLASSQRKLRENLGILETVIESTPDPILVIDRDGHYRRTNTAAARLIGLPSNKLVGKRSVEVMSSQQAAVCEAARRAVLEARGAITTEERIPVAGQEPRWHLTTRAPWFGPDGTLSGVIEIARDIHERKIAETEIQTANAQKDLLLRDINHRVKNHLQSLIATLYMSRRQIADSAARGVLDTTAARLSVLAKVYDRLQLREGGEIVVSARGFIDGLCADLVPALIDLRPITLRVDAADVPLELGRAVSIGLIVNEALTNALKYGFPGDASGNVGVLFEQRDDTFWLEVADDGIGVDGAPQGGGIGTRLIRLLAQQLRGTVEWRGPPGTQVVVTFPVDSAVGAAG